MCSTLWHNNMGSLERGGDCLLGFWTQNVYIVLLFPDWTDLNSCLDAQYYVAVSSEEIPSNYIIIKAKTILKILQVANLKMKKVDLQRKSIDEEIWFTKKVKWWRKLIYRESQLTKKED